MNQTQAKQAAYRWASTVLQGAIETADPQYDDEQDNARFAKAVQEIADALWFRHKGIEERSYQQAKRQYARSHR